MRVTLRILVSPLSACVTVYSLITYQWPGYPAWCYENGIDIFDHTQRANPYTLGHIAHQVAKLIHTFYRVLSLQVLRNVGIDQSFIFRRWSIAEAARLAGSFNRCLLTTSTLWSCVMCLKGAGNLFCAGAQVEGASVPHS